MRNFAVLLAMGALVAIVLSARPQDSPKVQDEKELRTIESQLATFEQQNDVGIVQFLADDFVGLGGQTVLTRSALQKNVRDNYASHGNGPNPYTVEKNDMRIDLFGNTAVVTYIKVYRPKMDPTKFDREDFTDVFTRAPKGWRVRLSKGFPLPTKANPS